MLIAICHIFVITHSLQHFHAQRAKKQHSETYSVLHKLPFTHLSWSISDDRRSSMVFFSCCSARTCNIKHTCTASSTPVDNAIQNNIFLRKSCKGHTKHLLQCPLHWPGPWGRGFLTWGFLLGAPWTPSLQWCPPGIATTAVAFPATKQSICSFFSWSKLPHNKVNGSNDCSPVIVSPEIWIQYQNSWPQNDALMYVCLTPTPTAMKKLTSSIPYWENSTVFNSDSVLKKLTSLISYWENSILFNSDSALKKLTPRF